MFIYIVRNVIFILEKAETLVSQIEFHRILGHSPLKAIKLGLQHENWNEWDPHLNNKLWREKIMKLLECMISGFRREVAENCALLGYYAV